MKQKFRMYAKASLSANLFLITIKNPQNIGVAINFIKNKKQESFYRVTKTLVREVAKNVNFLSLTYTQFPFNCYNLSNKDALQQYMLKFKPDILASNQYFFCGNKLLKKFQLIDESSFFKLFFFAKKVVSKV